MRVEVNVIVHGGCHEDVLEDVVWDKTNVGSLVPSQLWPCKMVPLVGERAELDKPKRKLTISIISSVLRPALSPAFNHGWESAGVEVPVVTHIVARIACVLFSLVPKRPLYGHL